MRERASPTLAVEALRKGRGGPACRIGLAIPSDSVSVRDGGLDLLRLERVDPAWRGSPDEPCEDWTPYVVAAIPKPVKDAERPRQGSTERTTGFEPAVLTRPHAATP